MNRTVDDRLINQLTKLKGKILLHTSGQLIIIGKFTVEDQTSTKKGKLTGRIRTSTRKVLTSLDLWGWNKELEFWGVFDESAIEMILSLYDLPNMRKSFENKILKPLEALGVNMVAFPTDQKTKALLSNQ